MIDERKVEEIFLDCLFKDEEVENGVPIGKVTIVKGLVSSFGLNSKRLLEHTEEITSMLDDMDSTFKEGWSFLNLCFDKNKNQWTGSHRRMEQLMCLGMAIGKVSYCVTDKKLWKILPGGMPYIVIS